MTRTRNFRKCATSKTPTQMYPGRYGTSSISESPYWKQQPSCLIVAQVSATARKASLRDTKD